MTETAELRASAIDRIERERAFWSDLVDEVGTDRMEEPGPMGDWTFRDLTVHLLGWRDRTLARLEAARHGRDDPPPPWPADLQDDDRINDWIQERGRERPVQDVLADMDRSFTRLAAVVAALPDDLLTRRGALPQFGDEPLTEVDLFGHLHDEHLPSIRAWLDTRSATTPVA